MRDSWLTLVDRVLRPSRPHIERCVRERDHHLAARRAIAEERARKIADCERRIESARAEVFAANDGVVSSRMTALEREWRTLSRPDPDAGLMDLWARIAPASWIDRKRWHDSDPAARLDAAIALAADASGVETAESAIDALRLALAPWGTPLGSQIRWRAFDRDREIVVPLLADPARAACEAVTSPAVLERARLLECDVREAAQARFPERPSLVRDIAHAAFVDCVWHAAPRQAPFAGRLNPVAPLRDLWKTGYVLSAIDVSSVTIEIA